MALYQHCDLSQVHKAQRDQLESIGFPLGLHKEHPELAKNCGAARPQHPGQASQSTREKSKPVILSSHKAQSYKAREGGNIDRAHKAAMLPELEKEIERRKAEVMSGDQYPTWAS